jgi:hypothetical protein
MGEDDTMGTKEETTSVGAKVIKLDNYRKPKPIGEWAAYEVDKNGNPVGLPIEKGLLYCEDPNNFRTS